MAAFNPAPLWYQQARAEGCTPQELRPKVHDFCMEAMRRNPNSDSEAVDESLVDTMMDMYEHAYRAVLPEESKG